MTFFFYFVLFLQTFHLNLCHPTCETLLVFKSKKTNQHIGTTEAATLLYKLQTFSWNYQRPHLATRTPKYFAEKHSASGASSGFLAQRRMGEVVQTPFSPERSSCGGRGELRPALGWRMFGERRRAEGRTERRRKPGGRMFKE